jgi:hypothetical protein
MAFLPLLLASAQICLALPAQTWNTFTSKQSQFRVRYPASWYLLEHHSGLDALSFPPDQRVRGVVLTSGGAELTVIKQPRQVKTVEQWIKQDLVSSTPESQREVDSHQGPNGCNRLVEVRWKSEAAPEQYFQETAYYCAAKTGLYRVRLTYWAGNTSSRMLDAVALKVTRSFRAVISKRRVVGRRRGVRLSGKWD